MSAENMKMNVATEENLMIIVEANQLNAAKAKKYVKQYVTTVEKASKSAWALCEVIYNTCHAADFKEAFGTRENYAKALGISKSAISKFERVVEIRKNLLENQSEETPKYNDMTVGQSSELLPIAISDVADFCEKNEITDKSTCKEIRNYVKIYTNGIEGDKEEQAATTEAETETKTEEMELVEEPEYSEKVRDLIEGMKGVKIVYENGVELLITDSNFLKKFVESAAEYIDSQN